MYIQKVDKTGQAEPEMGQKLASDWEMPNQPDDVNIFKLFEKKDEALIKAMLKKEKVNENMFKSELDNICKNIARETERSQFSSI